MKSDIKVKGSREMKSDIKVEGNGRDEKIRDREILEKV